MMAKGNHIWQLVVVLKRSNCPVGIMSSWRLPSRADFLLFSLRELHLPSSDSAFGLCGKHVENINAPGQNMVKQSPACWSI